MRFLNLILVIGFLSVTGCQKNDAASGGRAGASTGTATASTQTAQATVYTFEVSGNGVTFSADLHGYAQRNFGGSQVNPGYTSITLGASTNVYTLNGESMIASFTLNTGAGVLTIVTKKNGAALRTDTITTNATGISINDAN